MAGHLLPAHALLALLDQARQELSQEPNVLRLAGPVTVVGSSHGQFVDLLNLFLISAFRQVTQHTRVHTRARPHQCQQQHY
jgi:hypothetical protein